MVPRELFAGIWESVPQAGIEPATYRLEASRAALGTKSGQYLPSKFQHTHRRGGSCLASIVPPSQEIRDVVIVAIVLNRGTTDYSSERLCHIPIKVVVKRETPSFSSDIASASEPSGRVNKHTVIMRRQLKQRGGIEQWLDDTELGNLRAPRF